MSCCSIKEKVAGSNLFPISKKENVSSMALYCEFTSLAVILISLANLLPRSGSRSLRALFICGLKAATPCIPTMPPAPTTVAIDVM